MILDAAERCAKMVSIQLMLSLGPWTLQRVDNLGPDPRNRESCEACGKQGLRYVYVVALDEEPETVHRIGSECGPKLLEASTEAWSDAVDRAEQLLRLLNRLDKVIEYEVGHDMDASWAVSRRELLLSGAMSEQIRRNTGGALAGRERNYFRSARRRPQ